MCSCSSNIESIVLSNILKLIACLLVAEQNNELLLKNHKSRLTGSISLPEANAIIQVNRRGCGRRHGYYGRGRDRGRGRYNSWNRGDYNLSQNKNNTSNN